MAFGTDVIIDLPGKNRVQSNLEILNTWKAAGIPSAYITNYDVFCFRIIRCIEKSKPLGKKLLGRYYCT